MTVAGNLLLFSGFAVVLLGLRIIPRFRRLAVVTFIITLLWALDVLLLFRGLWQYATLVLAIGLATSLARAIRSRPDRTLRWVRRVAIVSGLVAGGMALRSVQRHWSADRSTGSRATAMTEGPNVLLLILDTVRASSLSLYGDSLPTTPELDSLTRDGVVFDRAYAAAPWTLPSHCAIFTGLPVHDLTCRWQHPLSDGPTTLAEVLRAHGYRTGGFVANHYYTTFETGLARGFDRWEDFMITWKEVLCHTVLVQMPIVRELLWGANTRSRLHALLHFRFRPDPKPEHDRKDAATVNREFLQWLDAAPGQPYFAFLNYFDAHDPYRAPAPWNTRFPKAEHDYDQYIGGIAYIDHELSLLLGELKRRGSLDHTIVVIASDHGEHFGEHGLYGHGNSLYIQLLHVPLALRYPPSVPAGARVEHPVSLRDLPATILDLAGFGQPSGLGGRSLRGTWMTPDTARISPVVAEVEREANFFGHEPARFDSLQALVDGHYEFIRTFGGREELFDLTRDPRGLVDIAGTSQGASVLPTLRAAFWRATGSRRAATTSSVR